MALQSDKFLDAIRAGHTRFAARFARRDNVDGDAPEWSDFPVQVVELAVSLRDKDTKVRPREVQPKGHILGLTPFGVRASDGSEYGDWAEYNEADYYGNGGFETEGWRMELLEVIE